MDTAQWHGASDVLPGLPEEHARNLGVDLSPATIDRVAAHPLFFAAAVRAAEIGVNSYRGHWILNRLLSDRGRFFASLMILDLHFVDGNCEGFTTAKLRREASLYQLCSPGRISAFVAALQVARFLAPGPVSGGRERRLVPTTALLDLYRKRWQAQFANISAIFPDMQPAIALLDDDAVVGAVAHTLVELFRRGLRLYDLVEELRPVVERDAGLLVIFSLFAESAAGQPVSVASMARRFSVSRAHVLSIMRTATTSGLASPRPNGGYEAGPQLDAALRRFFAVTFLLYIACINPMLETPVRP